MSDFPPEPKAPKSVFLPALAATVLLLGGMLFATIRAAKADAAEKARLNAPVAAKIESTPASTLFVDGVERGKTPLTVELRPGQEVKLSFKTPGFLTAEQAFVPTREESNFATDLKAKPYRLVGKMSDGMILKSAGVTVTLPHDFAEIPGENLSLVATREGFENVEIAAKFVEGDEAFEFAVAPEWQAVAKKRVRRRRVKKKSQALPSNPF